MRTRTVQLRLVIGEGQNTTFWGRDQMNRLDRKTPDVHADARLALRTLPFGDGRFRHQIPSVLHGSERLGNGLSDSAILFPLTLPTVQR